MDCNEIAIDSVFQVEVWRIGEFWRRPSAADRGRSVATVTGRTSRRATQTATRAERGSALRFQERLQAADTNSVGWTNPQSFGGRYLRSSPPAGADIEASLGFAASHRTAMIEENRRIHRLMIEGGFPFQSRH